MTVKDSLLKPLKLRDIIRIALDIYAISLILFLLLMLIPKRPSTIEMFSNLLHWGLLPSLPALIFLLVKRRWKSVVIWSVPSLAFLFLFGGLFLPGFSPAHVCPPDGSAECIHLRVMTFNVLGASLGGRQSQVDMIRNSDADIIALQEVNQEFVDSIEGQLLDIYPYRILFPSGVAGTGLLSKFPIRDDEVFILTRSASLNHCKAEIDIDGREITVISAHPPPPLPPGGFRVTASRYKETEAIVRMASETEGPLLLMGDFNITDQSMIYPILTNAGFKDSFREVGWGFGSTWPSRILSRDRAVPVIRLDYTWHTDEFQAQAIRVGPHVMSDHRPVIADLVLFGRGSTE